MLQDAAGSDPDHDIIERVRGGQVAEAFDMLVARYDRKLFRLSSAMLRNAAEAEDATQESLVRIWRALPSYDGRAKLSTWIYTIVRNRALTAIERRRDHDSLADPAVEQAAEAALAEHAAGSGGGSPEAAADERLRLLRDYVEALPERYRRALVLYYFEDRDVASVAALLGIPEGTVKTALHRGRALLLERLQRAGLAEARFWLEEAA